MELDRFRVCSTCRKEIAFEGRDFVCSASTCNRKRTGVLFCSMACWDAHLPEARHREAWAEERRAPSRAAWAVEAAATAPDAPDADDDEPEAAPAPAPSPRRVVVAPPASAPATARTPVAPAVPIEVLVVVSKLKGYVKARHGMNTSDGVIDVLSDILRRACDAAAAHAAADGRKTVMERDFVGYK